MRSYGETELQVENRIAGTIRVLHTHAEPALYPRLAITFGCVLRDVPAAEHGLRAPELSGYALTGIEGELRVGEGRALIGPLRRSEAWRPVRSSPFHNESQFRLACDLDHLRLERYEAERKENPPRFWVALWPVYSGSGKRLHGQTAQFSFEIPREEWTAFLSNVRYGDIEVLEVRRPTAELSVFKDALEQLTAARAHIDRGTYNSALIAARTALEAVVQEIRRENEDRPLRDILSGWTDEARGEAYAGSVSKLKDLCSRAVHHRDTTFTYTRAEARYVVRAVEGLLALLGDLRR